MLTRTFTYHTRIFCQICLPNRHYTRHDLSLKVTARAMPESSDDEELLPFKIAGTLSRTLTEAEQAIFEEDGYVVLRGTRACVRAGCQFCDGIVKCVHRVCKL